ncbi:MAG: hypothetical protein WCE90_05040 [Candidatus Zixiibacteriota bacterium]
MDTNKSVTFDNPQAMECETNSFRLRLDNGLVTFEPKEHFPSVDSARRIAYDFLRAWELDVALRLGRREIAFTFQDAHVVDRDPPPAGSVQVSKLNSLGMAAVAGSLTLHVTRRRYPEPPKLFRSSPDVETLWQRFEGYLESREPLPSMAYFCLTLIEAKAGGRNQAAKLYRINKDVLSKLGELTSQLGDGTTARKVNQGRALTPLTPSEKGWIEATVKLVIRRVGEIDSDSTLPLITMGDLPTL